MDGSEIALRSETASHLTVTVGSEVTCDCLQRLQRRHPPPPAPATRKPRTVALVGPPNSGKTTLFNRLTGLRQKVANFPGVTVEQHTGMAQLPDGREVAIIDLPGVYSLSPRSEDEQVTHDVLKGQRAGYGRSPTPSC